MGRPTSSGQGPVPRAAAPVILHPEFTAEGDVLIVCTNGDEQIGFRVNGTMLRMAGPSLANLMNKAEWTCPRILRVNDSVHDMHAFLRLLRLGMAAPVPPPLPSASSRPNSRPNSGGAGAGGGAGGSRPASSGSNSNRCGSALSNGSAKGPGPTTTTPNLAPPTPAFPPPFDPTIAQYAGIHRLTQKYDGWYPRAVLDFHVELHASAIVERLGPAASKGDLFALLRLAHALHSGFLWSEVCDRLRGGWWHETLNPWTFTDDDAAQLGQSIHSILSILASVSSRDALYSHLDELCVLYSDEGDVSVAAASRTTACPNCQHSPWAQP